MTRDNTVTYGRQTLQLPASPARAHYVKVREYPDGTLCHPDHNQRAAVLVAVKAGLENTERVAGVERPPAMTAPVRGGLQHVWVGANYAGRVRQESARTEGEPG